VPDTAAVLESVLQTLLREEQKLGDLIALAVEEQHALVDSDYPRIASVSDAMLAAAAQLDDLERDREALLGEIGQADITLDRLLPVAEENGVPGFSSARLALIARAHELREAQERNARLLLGAIKLQEKWFAMFGALDSPTYGSRGRQEHQPGRRFVSRSA
jgi:flagellar biosynthesis/type III secretory pathway chaperone